MNNYKVYFFLIFIFFFHIKGFAQFNLSGTILDENEQAVPGVELFDDVSQALILSNHEGVFEFSNLSAGLHQITLFNLEFETKTYDIVLTKDSIQDFTLKKLSIELSSIEIQAKRKELFNIKQLNDIEGTSIFAGKKTEVVIMDLVKGNIANNNGRQVFAQVSGLNIYEGSDGGLQLNLGGRGLDPNRTSNFNTRQNGYDISADVLGYPENYYTPPAESLNEIRVIRGASSLQYGTQFGGLIDFRIRKAPLNTAFEINTKQTIASYGAINSFNAIAFNKGKFSFNGFYKYKRGDGYRANSKYKSNNVFLSLDYSFNNKTNLGLEYTNFNYLAQQAGGLTDQQFESNPQLSTRSRNWFQVNWNLFNVDFKHQFNKQTSFSISLFGLDAGRNSVGFRGNPIALNENPITALDEQDLNGNYINPRDLILGKFKNHGAESRFLNKYLIVDKDAVLLVGAKYYRSKNKSLQGPGSLGSDADFGLSIVEFPDYANQSNFTFPNLNASLFAENIFYLSKKLSLTPGFRLEHIRTESIGDYNQVVFDNAGNPIANNLLSDDRVLKRTFVLLGLGLSHDLNKRMKLVANLSQNYRSVTFSDIRVASPTFIVDPNIKDEKGFTADLGIKGRVDKYLSYDLTAYSVLYDDRIGIILDDRANRLRKNIGQAIITGTESLFNFNFARFMKPGERDFDLRAYLNTAFTYSKYISSKENNVVGKKVEFIPTANLKSGLSGGFQNFNASFQISFISKQFTDVQNSGIASDGDNKSGIVGEIPAYFVADFHSSYQFKNFKFEAGINNLFNTDYFTRRATGYPGPGIIPSERRSFYLSVAYRTN